MGCLELSNRHQGEVVVDKVVENPNRALKLKQKPKIRAVNLFNFVCLWRSHLFAYLSALIEAPIAYFNLAPLGTSSPNVAITGLPSSPTDAANSMPCDS